MADGCEGIARACCKAVVRVVASGWIDKEGFTRGLPPTRVVVGSPSAVYDLHADALRWAEIPPVGCKASNGGESYGEVAGGASTGLDILAAVGIGDCVVGGLGVEDICRDARGEPCGCKCTAGDVGSVGSVGCC